MKFKDLQNKVHDIPDGFQHLLPAGCVQITDTEAIILLTPALTTRQTSAWQAIKAKREQVQYGGVLVGTKWFHTDESSRTLYNTLLATATEKALAGTSILNAIWKTMDGTFVPMTVDLVRQIRDTGLLTVSANYANAETHRAAMLLSTTPETYNFSTGWPAVYVPA